MGVIATAVRHLIAAGVNGDDLVRAIEDIEQARADQLASFHHPRTGAAERQARYRSGAVSDAEWQRLRATVFERDGFTCTYCGKFTDWPQCDHIIPRSRGGADVLENLTTSCKSCNSSKNDKLIEEWLR